MTKRLIIGLAGLSGTGKTTLSQYLAKVHGFYWFESSTYIQQAANALGRTLTTRQSYEEFFRTQQHARGLSWVSDGLFARKENRLLHSGVRSEYDVMRIREAGGIILGLQCPEDICVERIDKLQAKNPKTVIEYRQHCIVENSPDEYGFHTARAVRHADYVLNTAKPLAATQAELDEIIDLLTEN